IFRGSPPMDARLYQRFQRRPLRRRSTDGPSPALFPYPPSAVTKHSQRSSGIWNWLLTLLALGFMGASLQAAPAGATSALLSAEGTVEWSRAGQASWQAAKAGQTLAAGDRLRTGRHSRATVRLADLSVFRVNELSTLQIIEPGVKEKKPMLDLKSGST